MKGVSEMWLERPPVDHGCQSAALFSLGPPHCSTLSLEDAGAVTIKKERKKRRRECFSRRIHGEATHPSEIS